MISALVVNAGNYLYNLLLGRILGPEAFADAAILITFLLVLSFIAMTFQLATAKFTVSYSSEMLARLLRLFYKYALIIGVSLGIGILIMTDWLQLVFQTQSKIMFTVFGLGVPLYFIMSVNRGVLQGKKHFTKLAFTYQTEMLSRLIFTVVLLFFIKNNSAIVVASGIFISLIFGIFPWAKEKINWENKSPFNKTENKVILHFFALTAFYEFSLIIINNSDILLVKHYFSSYEAGLYASLALIGRVVYFIAWMFVMILLPKVISLQKENKNTTKILFQYVGYIGALATIIVLCCFLFPRLVVQLLFGESYISVAPMLWKYAIATSLFAIANIFAYYFLSLEVYIPVALSALFGLSQIVLIVLFHNTLLQVVEMQIIAMGILLLSQTMYFVLTQKRHLIN